MTKWTELGKEYPVVEVGWGVAGTDDKGPCLHIRQGSDFVVLDPDDLTALQRFLKQAKGGQE